LRARLLTDDGGLCARVLPNQVSGAVTSFAEADALVVVPADRSVVEEGAMVEVLKLADM